MSQERPVGPRRRPAPANPIVVTPLDYARVDQSAPATPLAVQYILGLLWPLALGLVMAIVAPPNDVGAWWLDACVVIIGAGMLQKWLRWRGFVPGMLTTVFLIPVGFFVWCTYSLSKI